jgi:hypothetical protein
LTLFCLIRGSKPSIAWGSCDSTNLLSHKQHLYLRDKAISIFRQVSEFLTYGKLPIV